MMNSAPLIVTRRGREVDGTLGHVSPGLRQVRRKLGTYITNGHLAYMLRSACISGTHACIPALREQEFQSTKAKYKISMLFLHQDFMLFPMVHLILL
jgi:hypothetical protein